MCGIAGIVSGSGLSPEMDSMLRRMLEAIRHRGPDDEGVYLSPQAKIGMRRLSIIDLTTGGQPFFDEAGRWVMVFNGEIYNYVPLRNELESRGHVFRSRSGGEIVVHFAEESGLDFVDRIRGMYAIALYDSRDKKLWLIRDRLGKKPLYYSVVGKTLLFGSEIKAILATGLVGRRLDGRAIYDYLNYLYIPHPRSAYVDIRKVCPGELIEFDGRQLKARTYWNTMMSLPRPGSRREAFDLEKLDRLVMESVKKRLQSDVRVGVLLSGGVDSGLVASYVRRLSGDVQAYTLGFTEGNDESEAATTTARHLGIKINVEMLSLCEATKEIPKIISKLDEPFGDSSAVAVFIVNRYLGRHVKVGLTGDGADEVFGGYNAYRYMKWLNAAKRMIPDLNRGKSWHDGARTTSKLRNFVRRASLQLDQAWVSLKDFLTPEFEACLAPDFLAKHREASGLFLSCAFQGNACEKDPVDTCMRTDLHTYLTCDILYKIDMMSMASSVELRSPFLDSTFTAPFATC